MDLLRWVVTGSFVLLAAMGLRLWWRSRSPETVWLSCMFLSLAAPRVAIQLLPDHRAGALAVVGLAVPSLLVVFPYLLFRFAESFRPVGRRWRWLVGALAGVMVLATVITSGLAVFAGEPAWFRLFMLAVVGVWTALTAWVVWQFLSAGRRQPTVARFRMWTMAAAAALLNLALMLAGLGETEFVVAAGEVAALASAVTFVLAFSPPRFVRAMWRQADERALWQAEGALVAADTRDAVVSAVLPHVATLLGGHGALFLDRDGNETVTGLDTSSREHVRRQLLQATGDQRVASLPGGVATIVLQQGRLGVATSAYTPVFGQDELELMERLGALLDLALSRAEASMTTAALAAFEQGLVPLIDPPPGLAIDTRYLAGLERLELGGDFMDVVAFPNGAAGFVIGDVSGHGPEEASFAVGVQAGWRTLATVAPHDPPAWLGWLDETFFGDHPERLVTALVGRIDIARRSIDLVSAGHCVPIVVGRDPHMVAVEPEPLLGIGHRGRRKNTTVTLREGQALFAYTDGLIEQPKPTRPDQRWSEAELLEWFRERDRMEDIDLDALLWEFGRASFADDVAIMLLRFEPHGVGGSAHLAGGPGAAHRID